MRDKRKMRKYSTKRDEQKEHKGATRNVVCVNM
jgi:hypothetical protein